MRLADMHIHTTFSPDGKSSMEEQCIKAIEIGIPIICFTDHVDFNSSEINVGRIINKASTNFDVSEYFYEVNRLRRIYNSIQILIGIEFSEPHLFPTEFEDYSYLKAIETVKSIKSVILVGSLSDDTYTGNAGSDIDLVHIIYDQYDYESEKKNIADVVSAVELETNNDIPISRTVYSERHLLHPYTYDFALTIDNKDLIERPIEIFRILDSGILLYGTDIVTTLEKPTRDDVQKTIELEQEQLQLLAKENPEWFLEYTEMRKHPTIRIMTQIVLTTALLDYYFYTGKSCSSKYKILELSERDMPNLPYLNLLRLCYKNRFSPGEMTEEDIYTMNREYKDVFLKE